MNKFKIFYEKISNKPLFTIIKYTTFLLLIIAVLFNLKGAKIDFIYENF